jgi:hypothetical protein
MLAPPASWLGLDPEHTADHTRLAVFFLAVRQSHDAPTTHSASANSIDSTSWATSGGAGIVTCRTSRRRGASRRRPFLASRPACNPNCLATRAPRSPAGFFSARAQPSVDLRLASRTPAGRGMRAAATTTDRRRAGLYRPRLVATLTGARRSCLCGAPSRSRERTRVQT